MHYIKQEGFFEIIGETIDMQDSRLYGFSPDPIEPSLTVAKADFQTLADRFSLTDLTLSHTSSTLAFSVAIDEKAKEEVGKRVYRSGGFHNLPHPLEDLIIRFTPYKEKISISSILEGTVAKYHPDINTDLKEAEAVEYVLTSEGIDPVSKGVVWVELKNYVEPPYFLGVPAHKGEIKIGIRGAISIGHQIKNFRAENEPELIDRMNKLESVVRNVYEPFVTDSGREAEAKRREEAKEKTAAQ